MKIKIGDSVKSKLFGFGKVVQLNMSGPIVLITGYNEMCIPEYDLELCGPIRADELHKGQIVGGYNEKP